MENLSVYSHNYILDSLELLTKNKDLQKNSIAEKIIVVTLIAFMYEAIANHYGQQAYKSTKKWQRKTAKNTPIQKIEILYQENGGTFNLNERPFSGLKRIFSVRNSIAHSKTESVPIIKGNKSSLPEPQWILNIKSINLETALKDQEAIFNELPLLLSLEKIPSFLLSEVRAKN